MLISTEYAKLNQQLHEARPDYGAGGHRWAVLVNTLGSLVDAASILDYGCGKGTLSTALPDLNIRSYDPAIPGLNKSPEPADLVVCTDVLEHVELECVENVLDDLCRVTQKLALLTVATRPAVKTLADGRNAHVTVRPFSWWRQRLLSRFDILEFQEDEGFEFCLILKALHADIADLPSVLTSKRDVGSDPLALGNIRGSGQKPLLTELVEDGIRMVFHTPNSMTRWRVQSFNDKEPHTVKWLKKIPQGSIFLDVGANVGMYSIFAAAVRKAQVYAFEPESQNFALLNQNIQSNGLSGKIIGYPLAISNEIALRPLYLSEFSQGGSCHSFGEKVGFDLKPRLETFTQGSSSATIDHLVDSGSIPCPHFIKVDVDGFEHKVLDGARKTLTNPLLRELLVELNTNLPEHLRIIESLKQSGFSHDPAQAASALRTSGSFKGVGEFIFRRIAAEKSFDFGRTFSIHPPRNADEWRVLQHVLKRIDRAPLVDDPFPHIVVDDIFPEDYYARMLESFPAPDQMKPLHETGRVAKGAYEERHALLFEDGDFARLDSDIAKFWSSLGRWMYSDAFANAFVSKFADALMSRLDKILQAEGRLVVKGDALLVQDHTRYAIGPHTDAPHRLVTFLFYLPTDASMRDLGTSIYRPKDPAFTCRGGPHHPFDRFDKVKTIEYLPNRLLAFPKTERSFHGVEQIHKPDVRRRLLINNVRILNESNP